MHQSFRIAALCFALWAAGPAWGDVTPNPVALDAIRADLNNGRADRGLQALNAVLAQQPQSAEAHNLRCRLYLQEGRWDDAVASCKAAVNIMPENSEYHLWLARAMGEKADRVSFVAAFKMAREIHQEFETAVRLDPHNLSALSDLGEFYVDAPAVAGGGADKAEKLADQVNAIAPDRAHYLRARVAESKKNYALAEQEFQAAIASAKEPASAWIDFASFYRRREQWADMIQAVHSSAAADTRGSAALVDGALLLVHSGRDLQFARQMLERYLASPNQSEDAPAFRVHAALARLLAQMGDKQGSQQQLAAVQVLAKDYQYDSHDATNTGR